MKTLKCLTFILLLSIISISYTQPKDAETFNNSLKSGKWAAQFELGTYINPSYFKSVELSIKPQLSRSSAFRLGVSINMNSSAGNSTDDLILGPLESKNTDLGLGLNYIQYLKSTGSVCFYIGFGPLYEYSESKTDYFNSDIYYGGNYSYETHASSRTWYAGGTAILGVEWFLVERISLLAEYNMVYKKGIYTSTETEKSYSLYNPTYIHVRNKNADVSAFQLNIVKLGLSAYF
ncbi:MAG: hypothetical protein ABI543_04375 [Ignavibacteria bacterium]